MIPITQRLHIRIAWLRHANILAQQGRFAEAVKAVQTANEIEFLHFSEVHHDVPILR